MRKTFTRAQPVGILVASHVEGGIIVFLLTYWLMCE